MNIKFRDIALFPSVEIDDLELLQKYPILKKEIEISDDLWIAPIDRKLADKIIDCCEPRDFFDKEKNQDGELEGYRLPDFIPYAFKREKPPDSDRFNWDIDDKLKGLIALSRIIHPTTISYQYSAKLKFDGIDLLRITPGLTYGPGSYAYIANPGRNWLTEEEAKELKQLWPIYTNKNLLEPCSRAMWYFECASQNCFLDVRCLLIAVGIESLINTDSDRSTKQFTYRIQKLSELLDKNINLNNAKATDMYDLRSEVAHGESINDAPNENLELYKQMEDILRLTIKKFIIDEGFYAFISDKDKVGNAWPLPKRD